MLLEAVAVLPHQGSRADPARHLPANGHLGRLEPERSLEIIPHPGNLLRHDQSMAQGSRFAFYQRSVGKHALPGYGSVTHGNRLVQTRMPGGVVSGGEISPATRLAVQVTHSEFRCSVRACRPSLHRRESLLNSFCSKQRHALRLSRTQTRYPQLSSE